MAEAREKRLQTLQLRAEPELVAKVRLIADTCPEFEGRAASVVRLAVREFTERKLAAMTPVEQERAA